MDQQQFSPSAAAASNTTHLGPYERARAAIPSLPADLRFRPLSHFVRPSDPCIPKNLLALSLDELARYSHDDLLRMPGVGPKKVMNLAALLRARFRSLHLLRPSMSPPKEPKLSVRFGRINPTPPRRRLPPQLLRKSTHKSTNYFGNIGASAFAAKASVLKRSAIALLA